MMKNNERHIVLYNFSSHASSLLHCSVYTNLAHFEFLRAIPLQATLNHGFDVRSRDVDILRTGGDFLPRLFLRRSRSRAIARARARKRAAGAGREDGADAGEEGVEAVGSFGRQRTVGGEVGTQSGRASFDPGPHDDVDDRGWIWSAEIFERGGKRAYCQNWWRNRRVGLLV